MQVNMGLAYLLPADEEVVAQAVHILLPVLGGHCLPKWHICTCNMDQPDCRGLDVAYVDQAEPVP